MEMSNRSSTASLHLLPDILPCLETFRGDRGGSKHFQLLSLEVKVKFCIKTTDSTDHLQRSQLTDYAWRDTADRGSTLKTCFWQGRTPSCVLLPALRF